jgi:hypothetical protein
MDFPNGEISLPKKLLSYKKCGLDIKFVDDNIKPHKKYLYAMKEHPEWTIITVDDDIYYRNDLIQELLNLHKLYPYAVCANTVHKIKIDKKKGSFCPYLTWNDAILESPMLSFENIAVGCNGVLYPADVFKKSKTALDIELIKRTSINADDLWLKAQEVLLRIPVCANKYYSTPPTIFRTKKIALMNTNTGIYINSIILSYLEYSLNVGDIMKIQ